MTFYTCSAAIQHTFSIYLTSLFSIKALRSQHTLDDLATAVGHLRITKELCLKNIIKM